LNRKNNKVLLLIYSKLKTPRLKYALKHIFTAHYGLEHSLTDDLEAVKLHKGLVINYSESEIPNSLQIMPELLLFQTNIDYWNMVLEQKVEMIESNFSKINFDIFAAVFFHISRYEEYLYIDKDLHQRFKHENSVLYESEMLDKPIVDIWIQDFKKILINYLKVDGNLFKKHQFEVKPTIDVDSIFAFKGKGLFRTTASMLKNLLFLQLNLISTKFMVLFGNKKDPFDNFDAQISALENEKLKANYFFLMSDYGSYDKNIKYTNSEYKIIIDKLKQNGHEIGIHPGYASNLDAKKVKLEIDRLNFILETKTETSRQHYLKMDLPKTYRTLLANGIKKDFTMGYADIIGFRAGTAFPFLWFDLEKNETTELEIVPFVAMDVALKNGMRLNENESDALLQPIIQELKTLNAPFCFVIHNESFANYGEWKGWQTLWLKWFKA